MPKKVASKSKKVAKKTTAAKKPAARKKVVKAAAKKRVVKKVAAQKAPAKKTAKKKVVAKKAPAKKAVVKKVAKKVAKPVKKPVAVKKAAPKMVKPEPKLVVKKAAAQKTPYKVGCYVVYPTHGVGRIMAEETQMIGEVELRMLVISFEKDKMTLRVPLHRVTAAGLRPVSTNDEMKKVFVTLKSKAKISRGMWSRRAQEYESKINSGCVISVAEVVRDLHQNVDQSERSYSERMIYESALARLVGELAAAEGSNHDTATDKLMKLLRGKVAKAAAAAAAAEAEKKAA